MPADEQRRELGPVRGRAAEPVNEQERRAAPPDEVAHPDALYLGKSLLQAGQFCVRHGPRLCFVTMNGLGGPAR